MRFHLADTRQAHLRGAIHDRLADTAGIAVVSLQQAGVLLVLGVVWAGLHVMKRVGKTL